MRVEEVLKYRGGKDFEDFSILTFARDYSPHIDLSEIFEIPFCPLGWLSSFSLQLAMDSPIITWVSRPK